MGSFLSSIENKQLVPAKENELFFNKTLQQIYEYHGLFKSICETFGITKPSFLEIFPGADQVFAIWELDQTEKVDALEIFSALIMRAEEATLKEKIKYFFSIYDFNDIRSISATDLQFMLVQICNSTYKFYRINSRVNNYEIADLVNTYFDTSKRINITSLFKFCIEAPEIKSFLKFIGRPIEQIQQLTTVNKKLTQGKFTDLIFKSKFESKKKYSQQQQISRYTDLLKKMLPTNELKDKLVTCKQKWVYGIRTDNIQKPFISVEQGIIYVISNVAIVYHPFLNLQKIYNHHKSEIISLEYSRIHNTIITGQLGTNSEIHFWNPGTLKTKHKLITSHQNGVHLLTLINYDTKLVTAGLRFETSIIIYSMTTFEHLQSFYLPELLIQIVPIVNLVDQVQGDYDVHNSFLSCSSKSIFFSDCSHKQVFTTIISIEGNKRITSFCAAYLNIQNPYLCSYMRQTESNFVGIVGFETGEISLINLKNYKQLPKELYTLKGAVGNIKITNQLLIASSLSAIYVFKISMLINDPTPLKVINMDQIGNFKLLCPNIRYFEIQQQNMLIVTEEGEFIQIQQEFWEIRESFNEKKWKCRKLCTLLKLKAKTTTLCVIQEKIAYLSSHDNRVISIDLSTHSVLEVWSISDTITAMDVISFQEGIIIFAIGKMPGNMLLRTGQEQNPRTFDCGSQIIDIKIASDYSFLSLCTKDSHIFVFSNTTNNLLSQAPKKLKFQNERPLSINFSDDNKSFFVCTNLRNVYQFYLPDLKNKNVFKDNDRMYISHWNLTYCYNPYNDQEQNLPAILGINQKPYLLTTPQGQIRAYQNIKDLASNSYNSLKIHLGPISKIVMCAESQSFYSLGSRDNAMIQWKILPVGKQTFRADYQQQINVSSKGDMKPSNEVSQYVKSFTYDGLCKRIQKDSFALFRGTTRTTINDYFSKKLDYFQPKDRLPSNTIIKPHHVYGVCSIKPKSVYFSPLQSQSILYFTSRFICSLNYLTQKQQIIDCTRMKISCIALGEDGIVAAGQAAENPCIKIVNGKTLTTTHKQGIIHMSIYKDLIYSFGIYQGIYSINVHNLKVGNLVNSRLEQNFIEWFLVIGDNQFLSFKQIRIWDDLCPSEIIGYATSGCILIHSHNVCISTKQRELAIIKGKQIIKVRENAHNKEITILKEINCSKGILVSGAKDQIIKIWGANFQQLFAIELKNCKIINKVDLYNVLENNKVRELVITNIDAKNDQILVTLKNGQVILFQNLSQDPTPLSILQEHPSSDKHMYNRQIHIDLHPKLPIMVSIDEDNYLSLKDYTTKAILLQYYFPVKPKAAKFSPNSKLLAVGLDNGEFLIFVLLQTYNNLQLNQIQKFQDLKSSIYTIEFSECCSYIAVSYLPYAGDHEESQSCKVLLYKSKDSQSLDNHYYKSYEIGQEKVEGVNLSYKLPSCACFMTFFKEKGHTSLLIYYQKVNQYYLRIGKDPNGQWKLFDIETKVLKKQQELDVNWEMTKFPSYVQCRQIFQDQEQLIMTDMCILNDCVIYGSINGDIYIVKKKSLLAQYKDSVKISDMCLARTYPCLTSFISQLMVSPDNKYLFCVGVADETIVQYELHLEKAPADISSIEDQSQQIVTKEGFYNYLNNIVPLRDQIKQILTDIETPDSQSTIRLEKTMVLGRRAYDRRNNLMHDAIGNLIFHVGTNIVLQNSQTRNQNYIPTNPDPKAATYQISQICFNTQKGLLAVATEEYHSNIYIWNIHSKICVSNFQMDCSIIHHMSFSDDGQMLVVCGLYKKYYEMVFLVELDTCKTLSTSSFINQNYWFLKSICFKHNSKNQFITSGVQHLSLWTYKAEMLTYQSFNIEHQHTTFMAVADSEKFTLTGCQAGNLYVWNSLILIYKIKIHESSIQSILMLTPNEVVTGCIDGQVAVTRIQLSHYNFIHKCSLVQLYQEQKAEEENTYNVKYSVQSLAYDQHQIYIGTRCGSIYSLSRQNLHPKRVSICHDNQKPASCCFDDQEKRFFYASNFGYLQIWNLIPLKLSYIYQFEKRVRKILSYKGGILVAFQKSIQMFEVDVPTPGFRQEYKIQFENTTIVDFIFNDDKSNLIVATTDKEKTDIILYKLDGYSLQQKSLTLNIQLQYLDISLDGHYILFKDKFQDIGIIQVKEFRRMNTIFIQFSIQWRSQGIRLNQDALNIHSCYNKENTITRILYLSDGHLLVGDELGMLRIFEYPTQNNKIGQLHTECYTDHLNGINGLEVGVNRKWVLSTSETDRSLILWRVVT